VCDRDDSRRHDGKPWCAGDGAQRFGRFPNIRGSASGFAVGRVHDERIGRIDHISHDALGDAAQRGRRQRPVTFEDARARQAEVDALGRRAVRQQLAGAHADAVWRAMRRFWPLDGDAIAARHQEEALADGGCIVVAAAHFTVVDGVAVRAQLADEAVEGLALLGRIRLCAAVGGHQQRAPRFEFLDVFQHDDARLALGGPAQRHPGQATDALLDGFAALGLAEVLAIGAEPDQAHRTIARHLDRIDVPHALAQMRGVRVIRRVHGQCLGIVVDGDIDRAAECLLQAGAGPAAAGEVVDDQFIAQVERHGKEVALHGRTCTAWRRTTSTGMAPATPR